MKTIIEMAREAAAKHGHTFKEPPNEAVIETLTEMYAMGAAEEREACAKVCEEQEYHYWRATEDQDFTPQDCADSIRARGNT